MVLRKWNTTKITSIIWACRTLHVLGYVYVTYVYQNLAKRLKTRAPTLTESLMREHPTV